MEFTDYDRITDYIMYLSPEFSLSFVTTLSRKSKSNEKIPFHSEVESVSKYSGTDVSRTIKRNFSYYFLIDDRNEFLNGFVLKEQDVYILTRLIENKLLPYYLDPEKRVFNTIDDKLVVNGEFEPVIYLQNEYKSLVMYPAVMYYENEKRYAESVILKIGNTIGEIDFTRFCGFLNVLKCTDMCSRAAIAVNYVKTQPYGVNIYSAKGLAGNLYDR